MTTVLDTSALMAPVESDLRLFEELDRVLAAEADATGRPERDPDPVVPEAVVAELADLAGGAGQEATAASVGHELVERCRVVATEADYGDDAVLELALREGHRAVTNDRELRRRLLAAGVPVASLRGRTNLAVTRP
jgi:rRNA-processing protein FCF1